MVIPNAVGRYMAAKIARSVALTSSFHERSTAARNPTKGRMTAARVMLRWRRLMSLASQAVLASTTRAGNDRSASFHMIPMNLATDRAHLQALSGVREELAQPMREALPALGRRGDRRDPRLGARVRAAARGQVRGGRAHGRRRRAQTVRRRRRAAGRGLGGVARRVREPRPGRVPAGADARSASRRVPAGRPRLVAAGRRRGHGRRRHRA